MTTVQKLLFWLIFIAGGLVWGVNPLAGIVVTIASSPILALYACIGVLSTAYVAVLLYTIGLAVVDYYILTKE